MAYTPTNWENREVEKPRTYIMTDNGDGTITLTPAEGQIFSAGTPLDAVNLNKIEQQIDSNTDDIETRVSKFGDTMTGTLTGTTINAQTNLQENGMNLSAKYHPKGDYSPAGQYPTFEYDPNGCSVIVGRYNSPSGKPIRVFFTTAQPAPSNAEHRVWIQIDWQV